LLQLKAEMIAINFNSSHQTIFHFKNAAVFSSFYKANKFFDQTSTTTELQKLKSHIEKLFKHPEIYTQIIEILLLLNFLTPIYRPKEKHQ
jgi:hypothetical protein